MNEVKALLESYINKNVEKGCWYWLGNKRQDGYGRIGFLGFSFMAHRFFYQIYNGNISDNLSVLHRCNNTSCVNPLHLYLGDSQDNCKDMLLNRIKLNQNRQVYTSKGLLQDSEREIILEILKKNNYSRILTAKELGISTTTLWRRLKKYDLLLHFELPIT